MKVSELYQEVFEETKRRYRCPRCNRQTWYRKVDWEENLDILHYHLHCNYCRATICFEARIPLPINTDEFLDFCEYINTWKYWSDAPSETDLILFPDT